MRQLNVELLERCGLNAAINEVSFFLDSVGRNLLGNMPWSQYDYLPAVHFAMAYGADCIFLKYYVDEKFVRAANSAPNTPVYEDSCVEIFIGFDDDKAYYNFEFNCIGAMLAGYGETKTERAMLPAPLIRQVKYQSVINNDLPGDDIHWELTVAIPFKIFCYHKIDAVEGKKCRANFYKCGDHLPTPHFISWSSIEWPEPNFHLPQFFGSLQFV